MEIKVGEYIRYNDGTIIKVIEEEHSYYNYLFKNKKGIFKHSPNIIDIIECGDYVNGYKVSFIAQDYAKFVQCDYPVETGTANHYKFYKESIKDVVTKEQFNQMKYIGGE